MKIKQRILCFVLLICVVFSCFVFNISASEAVVSEEKQGHEKFINVEEYKANCKQPGYDKFEIVGVETETGEASVSRDGNSYDVYFEATIYFYNPTEKLFQHTENCSFNSAVYEDLLPFSGSTKEGLDVLQIEEAYWCGYEETGEACYEITGYDLMFPYINCTFSVPISKIGDIPYVTFDYIVIRHDAECGSYGDYSFSYPKISSDFYPISYIYNGNYDLNKTSPYSDLKAFLSNEEKAVTDDILDSMYPVVSGKHISDITFFYEDAKNEEFYLYIYDSSGIGYSPYSEGTNVSLSLDGVKYKTYNLQYISSKGTIAKYSLKGAEEIFDKLDLNIERNYYIKSYSYRPFGFSSNAPLVVEKVDAQFSFAPIPTTYGLNDKGPGVTYNSNVISFHKNDVGTTFYQLNSSATGKNLYATLCTNYFSLPVKYFKSIDENELEVVDRTLSSLSGQYKYAYTKPYLVVDSINTYNKYKENIIPDKFDSSDYVASDMYFDILAKVMRGSILVSNKSESDFSLFFVDEIYENFSAVILVDDANDYYISPTELMKHIDNNKDYAYIELSSLPSTYRYEEGAGAVGPFDKEAYKETFYFEDVEFTFTPVGNYELLSAKEWNLFESVKHEGLWSTLLDFLYGSKDLYDDSLNDVKALVVLDAQEIENALKLSDSQFIEKYLVDEHDLQDIKDAMEKALLAGENFVLNRFDVFDEYKSLDVYSSEERPGNSALCKTKVYKDFEYLKMQFSNSIDTVVYDVDMEPIVIGPAPGTTPNTPTLGDKMNFAGGAISNFAKNPGFWAALIAFLAGSAGLISIILVVTLAIILFPYYSPFLPAIFDFFKTVFAIIGSWLKSFAKAIQNLFKRE